MNTPPPPKISARHQAAVLRNLRKAWQANRTNWKKTPARLASSRRTIQLAQEAIRGRPRQLSPAQLAAVRRNVARARAFLARRGRTPEHLAKLRETISKARAARTRDSHRLHNRKILRHGMYARSVRDTMRAVGQDPAELDRRVRLLKRYFASDDASEEGLIRALAETVWRHERFYYAQADWECRLVDAEMRRAAPPQRGHPAADEMRSRAFRLRDALLENFMWYERGRRIIGSLERLLRRLMRARFGPNAPFITSIHAKPGEGDIFGSL
jgi:hypothetical protein